MDAPLNVLYVSAELAPYASTGGLGDVARDLPRALSALGHDVRVAAPCYRTIPPELCGKRAYKCAVKLGSRVIEGTLRTVYAGDKRVPLYLVEHDGFYGRNHLYGYGGTDYPDNLDRFCFFCMVVLQGVGQTGWVPDIVHCNDWHTALIPAHIKTRLAYHPLWGGMPTVFTIHNMAYQGVFDADKFSSTGLSSDLFTPDGIEFYGRINLMKAGIAFASKLNTVSPGYAEEIQTPAKGHGLGGFLRTRAKDFSGILNGLDYTQWNPKTDLHLPANYAPEDLGGKMLCKKALQEEFGLPARDVPVFGMVTRFDLQKGLDLVAEALDDLLGRDIQVVVLGTGDSGLERLFARKAARYPGKMRVLLRYDEALAHRIQAGADFLLMPSRFEPCGLTQLCSLAYGTVPVVHATGGLANTIRDVSDADHGGGAANGIVFAYATAKALLEAVDRAIELYKDPEALRAVRMTGMRDDFSWGKSARAYVDLYREAIAAP